MTTTIAQRNEDSFFTSWALRQGRPKGLGKIGMHASMPMAKRPFPPPDYPSEQYLSDFESSARQAGVLPLSGVVTRRQLIGLYNAFLAWYRANDPDTPAHGNPGA